MKGAKMHIKIVLIILWGRFLFGANGAKMMNTQKTGPALRISLIFILHQLQEKHLGKHKPLYFAFVNLEKAFDNVPRRFSSGLWGQLESRSG